MKCACRTWDFQVSTPTVEKDHGEIKRTRKEKAVVFYPFSFDPIAPCLNLEQSKERKL